jgi:DNA-binding transcriptional regulator YiaG
MAATTATKSQVKSFISMLRTLKKESEIETNAEFADFLGVKERTLRSWTSGDAIPSFESMESVKTNLLMRQGQIDVTYRAVNNALASIL